MVDFSQYLNKPASAIEGFKPLPEGTYLCTYVSNAEKERTNKNDPNDPHLILDLQFNVNDAMDDVDRSKLPENFGNLKIWHGVFVKRMGVLEKQFAEAVGMSDVPMGDVFDQAKNRQVLVTITHQPSGNPEKPFVKVKHFAKA